MSDPRRSEARALSADELELVDKTHHPQLRELSDRELSDLVRLVRERRDRAQTEARRRRREMRGKAPAKGARPSADDTGSRDKKQVLATAVRRLNSERTRRQQLAARAELVENARNALALKRENATGDDVPATRTPDKGMNVNESERTRRTIPPAKVGSISQRTRNAQAKRDSR